MLDVMASGHQALPEQYTRDFSDLVMGSGQKADRDETLNSVISGLSGFFDDE